MLKSCLRRFGLWPVIAGVTVISTGVSFAITLALRLALYRAKREGKNRVALPLAA